MYKIKFTSKRSSPDINFYKSPKEFFSYRKEKYINTGKILSIENFESDDDKLTQVTIITFKDKDCHIEYLSDPEIEKNRISGSKYNTSNQIKRSSEIIQS